MDKISIRGAAILRENDDSRVITFRASTDGVDRHGTRVKPEGLDTRNYDGNPVFGWAHDLYGSFLSVPRIEHILGRTVAIRKTAKALDIDVEFAPAEINPTADMALKMVKSRFLNATSIGFIPLDIVDSMEDGVHVPTITKAELLEVSLVSIPSNPDALALSRDVEALIQKYRSTPPASPADLGVVIDALQGAFTEWQIRKAFESTLS